jgi:cytochrome c oxidase assembly protein subunit 15
MNRVYRTLVLIGACLAFVVVVVGAYVRLMDAGLGCPDWPGCYGEISPAHAQDNIARAVEAQGGEHGPVSLHKAWKEMFHRYLAGSLGVLILAIAVAAWRRRGVPGGSPLLASAVLVTVVLQAALGMWTVTLSLKPVVVTLHLLGGMATLSLLVWLALREMSSVPMQAASRAEAHVLRPWALLGILILAGQMALGGWVSSNYAALACVDFPKCHAAWLPSMDFTHGFQLVRELGRTAAGAHLTYDALTAIHWTHRVGALITFLYLGALAVTLMRARGGRPLGAFLALALCVQVALGVTNVLGGLPLAVAVAHNAGAAVLLVTLVVINFALSRAVSRASA